jgi:molybdate/tungstate transport system substrate-binding protein
MGAANGNYVSWYINFARSEMVIGYNPNSRFASDFQAAASGTKPWYQVLEESGLRLGRTDPILDPKGQATIYLMELAEKYYNQPGLAQKILGANENTSQIFPEEELVARLGAGQLDAGFFYINEAKAAHIPYIILPDQINLGNPSLDSTYATATWTNPQTKAVSKGGPIIFTLTIPSTSHPPDNSYVSGYVTGSTVVLTGHVRTQAQRDAVVGAAWLGHGVMVVLDELDITG